MFRTRHIRPLIATFALLSATSVVACGDSIGSDSDFVRDSWSKPTDHGVFEFGAQNPGEFTSEKRFHSWTFELTGDADIAVETKLGTQNLDSVLYLYKKQSDGRWGSYIAKNDDADDLGLGSRVKKSLGAGEYQIKVKASKSLMTGSFSVGGACSGDGCPTVENSCGPEDGSLPESTGYTLACAETMQAILTTPVGHSAPVCLADNLEERAVEYYKGYWNDIYNWEEMSDGEEPSVDVTHHSGAGTIVRVDLGGDEDAMDYVFDADGNVIFYYQHNQSPDWAWFCEGQETGTDPGDTCATSVAGSSDYRLEDTQEGSGSVTVADAGTLPVHIAAAISEYASETGLGATDAVDYSFSSWSATYNEGAEVRLTASGTEEISYTLTGSEQWGITITFRTDANGTDFLCKDL